MDEVAKWSQRWAPIPEKGEPGFISSTCKLCPGGCGIRVRVIQKERAVKIEGNPNHPVNRGGLCPTGLAGLQYLYHEDIRVKTPMKRDGARGEGKWKAVSWDEALNQVALKMKELQAKNQPHTLAFLDGEGDGSQARLVKRFLQVYGSPNLLRPFQLKEMEEVLTQAVHGQRMGLSYDLPRSQYVLSFGSALLDGWGNPSWTAQAYQEWRGDSTKKAKVVQVEPLASTTASLADEWVANKPGSEGSLALGLAQVMIEKEWYKKESVQTNTSGLAELREFLNAKYTPDQVAGETEIPKETILRLAKEFASAKQPVALWGKGKGETPLSLFEAQAVHLLNILVGSVNQTGGVYLRSEGGASPSTVKKDKKDKKAKKEKQETPMELGSREARVDESLSLNYPLPGQRMEAFFENASRNHPYPVNVLMIHEANPAFYLGTKAVAAALEQIPLVVSFSSFMDETSQMADLILPTPTFLERWDDQINCLGVPYSVYGLVKPVLPPLFETKSLGDILLNLSKKLEGPLQTALPYENMEQVVKQTAKGYFEAKKGRLAGGPGPEGGKASFESFDKFWDQLVAQGTWYDLENKGAERTGKWDLRPATFKTGAPKRLQSSGETALWMVPQSLLLLRSDYWPNPPFLTKYLGEETLSKDRLVAQIHPKTAGSLGVRQGQLIQIQAAKGTIKAQVHLFEGARPNCLFVPLGLGHEAFDGTLKDRGGNPFPLLDAEMDPHTGWPVARATRVKILKV
jgi:anaerobic selenocysteine-containing dehydrogenase